MVFSVCYIHTETIYHSGSQQWKIVIRSLLLDERFFFHVWKALFAASHWLGLLCVRVFTIWIFREYVTKWTLSLKVDTTDTSMWRTTILIPILRIFLDLFFCYPTPLSGHADNPESTLGSSRAINLVPRCVNDAFSPVYPRFTFSIPSCCLENWSLLSPWLELL